MIEDWPWMAERFGPFFIPFAMYFAWVLLTRVWPPGPWRAHPWMLLTIAGLVLVIASFLTWRFTSVEPTTGLYVAPHQVNGHIVPGYVKPAPPTKKP
jgi:hypothetical protein